MSTSTAPYKSYYINGTTLLRVLRKSLDLDNVMYLNKEQTVLSGGKKTFVNTLYVGSEEDARLISSVAKTKNDVDSNSSDESMVVSVNALKSIIDGLHDYSDEFAELKRRIDEIETALINVQSFIITES